MVQLAKCLLHSIEDLSSKFPDFSKKSGVMVGASALGRMLGDCWLDSLTKSTISRLRETLSQNMR